MLYDRKGQVLAHEQSPRTLCVRSESRGPASTFSPGMASDSFGGLAAISGSSCLIALLAYGSQVLFHFIDPGPLEGQQLYTFNVLVGCVWICYFQACFVDPGTIPKTWKLKDPGQKPNPARWCKKCDAPKPPRTHHCKTCKKYAFISSCFSI